MPLRRTTSISTLTVTCTGKAIVAPQEDAAHASSGMVMYKTGVLLKSKLANWKQKAELFTQRMVCHEFYDL